MTPFQSAEYATYEGTEYHLQSKIAILGCYKRLSCAVREFDTAAFISHVPPPNRSGPPALNALPTILAGKPPGANSLKARNERRNR
jgi:hypothetical protein